MINLYNINNHGGKNTFNDKEEYNMPTNVGIKNNISKYSAPNGELSGRRFLLAVWYVKNKVLLYKILVGALIALCVVFWGYGLFRLGDYLIFGLEENKRISRDLSGFIDYTPLKEHFSATQIQVSGTDIFNGGVNKVDIVSEVANPNNRYTVYFDYYFLFGDQKTIAQKGFFLPGESRPLAQLGLDGDVYTGSPSLALENIVWKRISSHEVADVDALKAQRINFVVSEFHFSRAGAIGSANANIIQFKLANNSPYGYIRPSFIVELYQNQSLVGVLPLQLSDLGAGETQSVDLRSFAPNLAVTEIKIYPIIDIFDKSVYMEVK